MPSTDVPAPRCPSRAAFAVSLALLVACGLTGGARAQSLTDPAFRPTRGLSIPTAGVTGGADATAVELNPAQLALMRAPSLVLVANAWSASTALPGRGAAALLGGPLAFGSAWGLALHDLGRSTAGLPTIDGRMKLQLAFAQRLGDSFALGVSWAHFFFEPFGGTDTFDVGASWRVGNGFALGLTIEDVTRPWLAAFQVTLPRVWRPEIVIRPLATDRLELGASVAHVGGEGWSRVAPRFRVMARPARGLGVFADFESVPAPAGGEAFEGDLRGSLGVWVDFAHSSAALALRAVSRSDASEGWGGTALVRVSAERTPPIVERQYMERVDLGGVDSEREYVRLVERLRAVARDRGVAAVLLKVDDLELGFGRIEELRALVQAIRAAGKPVHAYLTSPSTRAYYLASACDGIIVHPAGTLALTGIAQVVTFYKSAMDRLGVNVDLVRIAELKGAMEPFVLTEQSEPVRRNRNELLDDVFGRLVASIARARAGRGGKTLDEAAVRSLIDRGLFTPDDALAAGLVDAVKHEEDLEGYLKQTLGRPGLAVRERDPSRPRATAWEPARVAVVLVEGSLIDGPSEQLPFGLGAVAGSETLVRTLEQCRRDSSIAAVVLRVQSPGGSAFAADVVARAITKLRRSGKPVVASLGDVAASGGYYVAAPTELIFAEPSTTTGSIGVYSYKVDVRKLATELGVTVETYRRGAHADYLSPYRPWTSEELKLAGDKIRHTYQAFLKTVADGRKARGLTVERVDELGRGHVWTGAQALERGLVDRLGGLGEAIDFVAERAGVPAGPDGVPPVVVLPRPALNALEQAARLVTGAAAEATAPEAPPLWLGARVITRALRPALRLVAPMLLGPGTGVEARMPFDLELR